MGVFRLYIPALKIIEKDNPRPLGANIIGVSIFVVSALVVAPIIFIALINDTHRTKFVDGFHRGYNKQK